MRLVRYHSTVVALVTPDRARLMPAVERLSELDAERRFVSAICLFAMQHEAGALIGRYHQAEAERFAREVLMPRDEFASLTALSDDSLAELFGAPVAEVARRRREV